MTQKQMRNKEKILALTRTNDLLTLIVKHLILTSEEGKFELTVKDLELADTQAPVDIVRDDDRDLLVVQFKARLVDAQGRDL